MLSYNLDFNSCAIRDGFRKSSHIYSIVCLRFLIASCVAKSSYMITYTVVWEKFKVGNFRVKKVRGKNIFVSADCR